MIQNHGPLSTGSDHSANWATTTAKLSMVEKF